MCAETQEGFQAILSGPSGFLVLIEPQHLVQVDIWNQQGVEQPNWRGGRGSHINYSSNAN